MRKTLNKEDIKEIRYQCRMGYIIPSLIFIIGSVFAIFVYEVDFNTGSRSDSILIVASGFALLSFFIGYRMNWKYYADIRNNEKIVETKTIQKKESKKDYEAGSGNMTTLPHNNPMKEFIRYDLIIENTRHRIDKELFDTCSKGDEVFFFYAPKSRYLLSIERKKK